MATALQITLRRCGDSLSKRDARLEAICSREFATVVYVISEPFGRSLASLSRSGDWQRTRNPRREPNSPSGYVIARKATVNGAPDFFDDFSHRDGFGDDVVDTRRSAEGCRIDTRAGRISHVKQRLPVGAVAKPYETARRD